MRTVYDMSTGQTLENSQSTEKTASVAPVASIPELRLQLVTPESREERDIPPELVLADLNAFLETMS
ncbi:MAG: hypothetical protein KZQ88_16530 [Candidatus Thiodiazotropha sp. (ex Dulcina madagascariensis)]|nr:hypothetical protein [Candidatus Thiodiazotropha sp. (ex Dulcina madagascariensis)]MCU7924925.1 hypothetical protein [Candidatus Thiodiazotropha sp. (ex Dulcina madagascariensis)]